MEALSKKQLLAVLAAAKAASHRDWLMMVLHFWHGGRNSEIIHLTKENVRGAFLVFDRLKGSERCEQELVEHANPLLDERQAVIDWALKTPYSERLFNVSRFTYLRHFKRYCAAAGVPEHIARTTVLKHTLGTLMIENTPINKVQRRMGHKNISSTAQYLKVKESEVDSVVKRAVGL